MDSVVARVMMEIPEASIVMVGDDACRLLEQGWESEPRVIRASGELTIRQTLTLASLADCVLGPETGVLNAVAFAKDVGKVILLSHSSVQNLTKHWVNTVVLTPHKMIDCYPCHRLHYSNEFCRTHEESGAAMCAASIDADDVFAAVKRLLGRQARKAA
jgi:ADP-heptose:LPS heptosyltransferase